ncbi:MAG TPA: sensor histidine kinase [Ktedonobacterales bacterium]|nr:sensor histidine kinase [Ktedonobacterales bacterium]
MSIHPIQLRHRLASRWPLSIFEKVIVANSAIILLETAAGWWITQHNPDTYHYLIDTTFIALAAVFGMAINFLLLRAAFAPLHGLLATIQAVGGNLEARAVERESDAEVWALARTFNAMLDRLTQARHDAAGHVLRAQEEERRRLALELHDQIGQSLTALTLHAEALRERLAMGTGQVTAQVQRQAERLIGLTQRTLAEVQTLSRQLRPPLLDDLGLVAALRWLADDVQERFGISIHLQLHLADDPQEATADETPDGHLPDRARLPGEVETALFRIAQESLTNAIRHGQARQIQVTYWQQATQVRLTIADNGAGFTPAAEAARGVGLEGMRERAQLLGGVLQVRSGPGEGCVVRVAIPLTRARAGSGAAAQEHAPALQTNLLLL